MAELCIEISRALFVVLMCIFVLLSYYMASMEDAEKRKFPAAVQTVVLLLFHAAGYLILWIKLQNIEIAVMYVLEVFFLLIFMYAFHVLYPRSSQAFLNNICFFMALGFVMVTRLDMDKGQRQFLFLFAGGILSLILPWLMTRIRGLRKMSWLYAAAGIIALAVVVVFGRTDYGANLAVELGGFSLQPAEFVKIVYVFFIAAMLRENTGFKNIVITSFLAAVHVVILVLATDLGSAFIYFCAYVIMLYSATGKPIYAGLGIGGGAAASYIAYQLFSHVKTRVVVWLDPWSYIDNEGYQITQSLFGIGMGSWLGSGLFDGMPEKIPFVEKDFMFSAIAEEFGVVFAIGVILLCLNTVLLMLQAGMKLSEPFYRLLAVGFASVYGIQVFLTIGGGMNLIPITGVTLPLVSYGGSSAVSTLLMFAIVQGLNLIDEVDTVEKRKRKKSKTT